MIWLRWLNLDQIILDLFHRRTMLRFVIRLIFRLFSPFGFTHVLTMETLSGKSWRFKIFKRVPVEL